MITDYLNALKSKGNFTYETISNLSGIPEATVKNIFTGKTETPRFDTVSSLVTSMGGSLDAIYNASKTEDVEGNAIIALKESYEHRIADIKASAQLHMEIISKDKRHLWTMCCVLGGILAVILFADILLGNVGWIRY